MGTPLLSASHLRGSLLLACKHGGDACISVSGPSRGPVPSLVSETPQKLLKGTPSLSLRCGHGEPTLPDADERVDSLCQHDLW